MKTITFKEVERSLAWSLVDFVDNQRKIGKSLEIDGKTYTLETITSFSAYGERGMTFVFEVDRSIIRISDRWSKSNFHPRSKKFNDSLLQANGVKYSRYVHFEIDNKSKSKLFSTYRAGKYGYDMLAGIVSKAKLNAAS